MQIYCINNDEISKVLGENAPLYKVALNWSHLAKTKTIYFLNISQLVWTDLIGFDTTYWVDVFGYQELTFEDIEKWCWKLNAMLQNETILMWQLREYMCQYRFNYRDALRDILASFEEILKSDDIKNSRYIIGFLCEKAAEKSMDDWWVEEERRILSANCDSI